MIRHLAFFVALGSLAILAQDPPASEAETPRSAYEAMIGAQHWRDANAARDRLIGFGEDALDFVRSGAEHHEDDEVRRRCYDVLVTTFPTNERALRTIENDGLADASSTIRYMCAFHLGQHKVFSSFRRLQHVLTDSTLGDELTRYAAAKSLAELGEPDGLPLIYDGVGSDWYMHRYLANTGLAALTGKDVNDFGEGYDWHEDAFVSGGVEARSPRRPVEDAQRRSARFAAIARYCAWLRDAHPEFYKHVDGSW